MPRHSPCALFSLTLQSANKKSPIFGSLISRIMQALVWKLPFRLAKIALPLKIIFPLLLPSHNCINNNNVQFSRCILNFLRNSMKHHSHGASVNLLLIHYSLLPIALRSGGPKWTRFSAEKPRRLQQSTGLLPRAAFRVHFGTIAS